MYVLCICMKVRDSLEKVRERMYGQFGGMQQSMQKLSQEIKVMNYVAPSDSELPHQTPVCEGMNKSVCLQSANSHRRSLESEVRIRTSAMESFDQMNSSLISANIGLQVTHHCH